MTMLRHMSWRRNGLLGIGGVWTRREGKLCMLRKERKKGKGSEFVIESLVMPGIKAEDQVSGLVLDSRNVFNKCSFTSANDELSKCSYAYFISVRNSL